jgi:transposase
MEAECRGCRERDARIAALEERLAELEGRMRDLTKPPEPPRPAPALPKGPAKKATGNKPGGQPGHPPHAKKLVPPERVSETVPFIPRTCQHCQAALPQEAGPNDPPPVRHQVAELPEVIARITEYQGHARTCPCCGKLTRAAIPIDIRASCVGSRLAAVLSYLAGYQGVSKRGLAEIAEVVFDAPMALGTVANLEQEMSQALRPAHQEAQRQVQQAPVKNVDETGWKQAGHKRWLWVAASTTAVVFLIQPLRDLTALQRLLGKVVRGIVCSDRWCVYNHIPLRMRQICWAHLQRNWEKLLDRGGRAKEIAQMCLSVHERVFELWHLFRGGGCTRAELKLKMRPLRSELCNVLHWGARSGDARTKRLCARLIGVSPAMWTFVDVEGVEPTNNHGERVQRRAVLWRRRSFGCHSANGCRFVERILTVVQSLHLQRRSVLPFLYETILAHRSGTQTPKLVIEG